MNELHPVPDAPAEGEEYLTPADLSRRWRGAIKVKTLRNWRHHGKGPRFLKLGNRVLYPLSAVVQYEKSREKTSTANAA